MADVFGRMVADYHRDELTEQPVYRRSDGETSTAHCAWYFTEPDEWGAFDREGIGYATGRVLDVGSGVGRAILWLQAQGQEAVGIDHSPGAVTVSRKRGAPAVVGDMTALPFGAGTFDTALFVGTHLGAVETQAGLRSLLDDLDRILGSGGRIVADLYDPTLVEDPELESYLDGRWRDSNVATRRFRLEYDGAIGDWMTLLMCSPTALGTAIEPTSWSIEQIHRSDGTRYYAVLERTG